MELTEKLDFLDRLSRKTGFAMSLSYELEDISDSRYVTFYIYDKEGGCTMKMFTSIELAKDPSFDMGDYLRHEMEWAIGRRPNVRSPEPS